jgi:hypothetical protein
MKYLVLGIVFLLLFNSATSADGGYPNTQAIVVSPRASVPFVTPTAIFSGMFDSVPHDLFWTLLSAILGGFFGLILVMLVEWLKTPSAKIELIDPLNHPSGRKFLKIKVNTYTKGWVKKIFPWQNPASFATIKGYLIDDSGGEEVILTTYVIKWDSKPEPWDYDNNRVRLELLPSASEAENFLSEDEETASVAVKHPNDSDFYLYEANYYVNPQKRTEKEVKLRLVFSSSSASAKKDFIITNSGTTITSFDMSE